MLKPIDKHWFVNALRFAHCTRYFPFFILTRLVGAAVFATATATAVAAGVAAKKTCVYAGIRHAFLNFTASNSFVMYFSIRFLSC